MDLIDWSEEIEEFEVVPKVEEENFNFHEIVVVLLRDCIIFGECRYGSRSGGFTMTG